MKKILFSVFALVGLLFALPTEQSSASAAEKDYSDLISQVKVYDQNGNQIPYTEEELGELVRFEESVSTSSEDSFTTLATYLTFDYGPITFYNNFYIGSGWNGKAFYNPVDTVFTVKGTAQKIKINAYNDTGTGSGTLARSVELPGGWTGDVHVSTWSSMTRGKSYRFNVINVDRKSFTVNNVEVWYD